MLYTSLVSGLKKLEICIYIANEYPNLVLLGVAIMPTGQQLYSPTGFLPVPMSSPSGYAAGDLCLYQCVCVCVCVCSIMREWPSPN